MSFRVIEKIWIRKGYSMKHMRSNTHSLISNLLWYGWIPYCVVFHYIGLSLVLPFFLLGFLVQNKISLKPILNSMRTINIFNISFLVFILFIGISSVYSIHPTASITTCLKLFGLFLVFLILKSIVSLPQSEEDRSLLLKKIQWSFTICLGLFLAYRLYVDFYSLVLAPRWDISPEIFKKPGFFYDNKTTGSTLLLLFWPLVYASGRLCLKKATVLYLILGVALFRTDALTAQVAYLGAPLVAVLIYWGATFVRSWITLGGIFLILFIPWLSIYFLTPTRLASLFDVYATRWHSLYHRLHIWYFSAHKAFEKIYLGWGAGASKYIPEAQIEIEPGLVNLCSHPHNNYIQIWLELGAVGAALIAFVFFIFGRTLNTFKGKLFQTTSYSAVATALIIMGMSYSAWHMWWLSNLFMAALCFLAFYPIKDDSSWSD